MTDFTKLIYTSLADALKNTINETVVTEVQVETLASSEVTTYVENFSLAVVGGQFAQMLIHQDNVASPTAGVITSTTEYLYYNGGVQLVIPADVSDPGAFDEVPTQVRIKKSGDNLNVETRVINPYSNSVDVEATTITVYFFAYLPFQDSLDT